MLGLGFKGEGVMYLCILGDRCPSSVWWGRRCFPGALPIFAFQVRSNPGAHGWVGLPGRVFREKIPGPPLSPSLPAMTTANSSS